MNCTGSRENAGSSNTTIFTAQRGGGKKAGHIFTVLDLTELKLAKMPIRYTKMGNFRNASPLDLPDSLLVLLCPLVSVLILRNHL